MPQPENQLSESRSLDAERPEPEDEDRFAAGVEAFEAVPENKVKVALSGQEDNLNQPGSDKKVKTGSSRHDGMRLFKILCDEIAKTNSGQAMFLKRGQPALEGEGHLAIIYTVENKNFYQFVNKPELLKGFETALLQKMGEAITVSIRLEEENFNELDLLEKTLRIVNDEAVKIITTTDKPQN